jgi:DNA-directed RNA polymerase specialized sigma24 family protein
MVTLRIEGHEVAEIARLTNRSHRTVERLLQQARERLTELMGE